MLGKPGKKRVSDSSLFCANIRVEKVKKAVVYLANISKAFSNRASFMCILKS
jgi:hypothetical protein